MKQHDIDDALWHGTEELNRKMPTDEQMPIYTCNKCEMEPTCAFAWEDENLNGECVYER